MVTVKSNFHVIVPPKVRDQIGVSVGDVFEASAKNGSIVLERKSVVDSGIAMSMAEFDAGKSLGPFDTHEKFLGALHKQARKASTKKPKRPAL